MLDTNAVRAVLERRSPALDRWFCEKRCSISAIVAADISVCATCSPYWPLPLLFRPIAQIRSSQLRRTSNRFGFLQ